MPPDLNWATPLESRGRTEPGSRWTDLTKPYFLSELSHKVSVMLSDFLPGLRGASGNNDLDVVINMISFQ